MVAAPVAERSLLSSVAQGGHGFGLLADGRVTGLFAVAQRLRLVVDSRKPRVSMFPKACIVKQGANFSQGREQWLESGRNLCLG